MRQTAFLDVSQCRKEF